MNGWKNGHHMNCREIADSEPADMQGRAAVHTPPMAWIDRAHRELSKSVLFVKIGPAEVCWCVKVMRLDRRV
jgi:hypothetical protein